MLIHVHISTHTSVATKVHVNHILIDFFVTYRALCALKVAGRGEAVWAHVVGDHVDENNDSS